MGAATTGVSAPEQLHWPVFVKRRAGDEFPAVPAFSLFPLLRTEFLGPLFCGEIWLKKCALSALSALSPLFPMRRLINFGRWLLHNQRPDGGWAPRGRVDVARDCAQGHELAEGPFDAVAVDVAVKDRPDLFAG